MAKTVNLDNFPARIFEKNIKTSQFLSSLHVCSISDLNSGPKVLVRMGLPNQHEDKTMKNLMVFDIDVDFPRKNSIFLLC